MSTLRVGTLSNSSGSASVPSDTVISGTAKAWVNFNGTGTVAIRSQFNVSSITDNGTGDYTVNFTNALSNANYVPVLTGVGYGITNVAQSYVIAGDFSTGAATKTTSALRVQTGSSNTGAVGQETAEFNVAIFR